MAVVLIIGAKSDIARSLARVYGRSGCDLYLAARNRTELENDITDLKIRYNIQVSSYEFDVTDYESHRLFYEGLNPKPDGVLCVAGYLGDNRRAYTDFTETQEIIDTNFTGCVSILNIAADDMERRKQGFIVGISSVSGDRGRHKNCIYGSAKAGFTAYLSGLRNRLSRHGVQVLTVKPGYVNTKMTEGLKLPDLLTSEPDETARDIFNAQQKGKDIVYSKWFWKYIMIILLLIPEKIFKRLDI